jgi:hypothetical protein
MYSINDTSIYQTLNGRLLSRFGGMVSRFKAINKLENFYDATTSALS